MTINFAGSAIGPGAGTAGEVTQVQLVRDTPGWWTSPLGIEHRLSKYVLDIAFEHHASFAVYPDHLAYRRTPTPAMFAMNVTGTYKVRSVGHEMEFAIKPSATAGLIAFSNATHLQAVHVVTPWNPADSRVIKPFQAEAFPMDSYGNFLVNASEFPRLSDWLDNPEPYVGGPLARTWQQLPTLPPPMLSLPPAT